MKWKRAVYRCSFLCRYFEGGWSGCAIGERKVRLARRTHVRLQIRGLESEKGGGEVQPRGIPKKEYSIPLGSTT